MDIRIVPTTLELIKVERGREGEQKIYESIKHFEHDRIRILRNVFVPKSDDISTELDIVLITTKGIVVIESKNLNGNVYGKAYQKYWVITIKESNGAISRYKIFNPCLQNESHIKWLQEYLNNDMEIHSLVVFSDTCKLKNTFYRVGTDITQVSEVAKVIGNILNKKMKTEYSQEEVDAIYKKLLPLSNLSKEEKEKHYEAIRERCIKA